MAATRTATVSSERRSDRAARAPRVYVCILNWNGWRDTLCCLESVLRSRYENFQVLLCDNASTDGSVDAFHAWAAGRQPAPAAAAPDLRGLLEPPVSKPVELVELTAEAAARRPRPTRAPVVLLHSGANRGFAGGNNVALRHALARGDADYVWLLNNDTVVTPNSLTELVAYCRHHPDVGLCGSRLLTAAAPHRVQALAGARFNPWLGTHRALGAGLAADDPGEPAAVEARMAYVIGASMFASRRWLERVGLLCEDYFLYFEEIDWAVRGRRHFRLGYAAGSVVYHKEGATIGRPAQSASAELMALRNRLRFTRKRLPWALPTVWLGFLVVVVNRIRRGQADRVGPILRVMFGLRRSGPGAAAGGVKRA